MKKINESLAYCIASVTLLFLCFKTQAQDSLNVYHIKYRYLFTADDPTAKPTEGTVGTVINNSHSLCLNKKSQCFYAPLETIPL
jgi:hypothetical protein